MKFKDYLIKLSVDLYLVEADSVVVQSPLDREVEGFNPQQLFKVNLWMNRMDARINNSNKTFPNKLSKMQSRDMNPRP